MRLVPAAGRLFEGTNQMRDGSRPCENVFYFPKTARSRAWSTSTRPS